MNCPYCDEGIHPGSKFCPKCGLPLKEDSTISGTYVTDDAGMNPWVVGLGGVGIVAVALSIGFFSARGDKKPDQTVRREPVRSYTAPGANWGGGRFGATVAPGATSGAYRGSSAGMRPFTPEIPVRWAYNPPATPPRPVYSVPVPDPQPPPVPLLAMNRLDVLEPREVPRVTVVRATTPEIPALPLTAVRLTEAQADRLLNGGTEPTDATEGDAVFVSPSVSGATPGDSDSAYVWDPVQERWALRPDYSPRRRGVVRSGGATRGNLSDRLRGTRAAPGIVEQGTLD